MNTYTKIVIIGAGPTGLGAAYRLKQLGYQNYLIFERDPIAGGLARSFKDDQGFTWDIGGHVQFSHYSYFDSVMNHTIQNWIYHNRESWCWLLNRFIPYPFQQNIHRLPPDVFLECIDGIINSILKYEQGAPSDFQEWINKYLGLGIAKYFMNPYNTKVWAFPPAELNANWVGDRAALVDLKKILECHLQNKNNVNWGPNNQFRFPANGGTGAIWENLSKDLNIIYNTTIKDIDTQNQTIIPDYYSKIKYDWLINTAPLDWFVNHSDLKNELTIVNNLRHSSVHIIGIGIKGSPKEELKEKCWMYFPENDCPFYRVTLMSKYAPSNAPEGTYSLMCEVSESEFKRVDHTNLIENVIQGLKNTKLIPDNAEIVSKWMHSKDYGYPTPSKQRDEILGLTQPALMKRNILSRGRFGGWKYEVSNQDHSFMQGVEAVDFIIHGRKEITYFHPEKINGR